MAKYLKQVYIVLLLLEYFNSCWYHSVVKFSFKLHHLSFITILQITYRIFVAFDSFNYFILQSLLYISCYRSNFNYQILLNLFNWAESTTLYVA